MSTVVVELPGVYLDTVASAATSGVILANTAPEASSIEAAKEKALAFDLLCTNGNAVDKTNTDVWVDGVQAVSSGVGANGWSAVFTILGIATDLIPDSDMELAGVASWSYYTQTKLTKEPGSPGGSGTQVLRLRRLLGTNYVRTSPASSPNLPGNTTVRIRGWARSDGTITTPRIRVWASPSYTLVWSGTSSTTWQPFDFTYTNSSPGAKSLVLEGDAFGVSGFCWAEFDDIIVDETAGSDYNVALSKAGEEWDSEEVVPVRVVSQDDGGPVDTLDETYSFTVEDYVLPTVVSASAEGPETVRVTFSEGMLASAASGATDALNPSLYTLAYSQSDANIAAVSASVTAVSQVSATVYELTTDIPLTFWKTYTVTAEGVADDSAAGNVTASPNASASFTAWAPPDWPDRRSFDFYEMFSDHDHTQDVSGDLEKTCSIMQDVIDVMLWKVSAFSDIWDVDDAPIEHVRAMLADLGNPFDIDFTEAQERKLLELLVPIYKQKGTEAGIINLARFFAGLEITDIVPGLEDTWILGDEDMGLLGVTTVLAPSSSASRFSFNVIVDRALTSSETSILEEIIRKMKCVHEHAYIVEPADPDHVDHWELGLSEIGFNTYLHT